MINNKEHMNRREIEKKELETIKIDGNIGETVQNGAGYSAPETSLQEGRVIYKNRGHYRVQTSDQVFDAVLSGRFKYETVGNIDFPAVGDWVTIFLVDGHCRIESVKPRRSVFVRKQKDTGGKKMAGGVGTTQEQVIAANVDKAIIVTGLDGNYNLKRIERFITLAYNSGAKPIIVMSKRDLCPTPEALIEAVKAVAFGIPVIGYSAVTGEGFEMLSAELEPTDTIVLIGSSGVGKSTLTNKLLSASVQKTGETQLHTAKGKHTTTAAQLLQGVNGLAIIDTPGVREVQLWADEETLDQTFDDIGALTAKCRFNNCTHGNEPGCAVRAAIESGALTEERYAHYLKLQREIAFLNRKKQQLQTMRNRKQKHFKKR
ncbi:ribosome small subunit-dependent GTPase A [Fusibacter paucivorans]|uniref:Small ribosomal subunit biogenesis GTPase RsgA n=1 Tax=Fusibacter paucivorans TaxID=76009 RepID=A0ABS5PMQ2_9FIRM|nr:ribosome small subunit-dependent GTPase A [Fusibacter paucivorans]MBS7526470.1 ribosome small subunit-dependent GTPase A [Fusibacter paucivorans]